MTRPHIHKKPRKYLSDLKPGTKFTARRFGRGFASMRWRRREHGIFGYSIDRDGLIGLIKNPCLQVYPV